MKRILAFFPLVILDFLMVSCEEPESVSYRQSKVSSVAGAGPEPEPPVNSTQNQDDATIEKKPNPGPIPSQAQRPLLQESQAQALLQGSCLFAGCHADGPSLLQNPNSLMQLSDKLMPPPNQSRYTLRDQDRADLVRFLNAKAGMP